PDRGLTGEGDVEVSGFRIKPIHSEKLHMIMVFRGRSTPDHADYATFLMAGVEGRFEETLQGRDQTIAEREGNATSREATLAGDDRRGKSRGARGERSSDRTS